MIRVLRLAAAFWACAAGMAAAAVDERSEKSLMFAGRCLAQVMTVSPVDVDGLERMPELPAKGHLFGEPGAVWYGSDDRVVLVFHKDSHCGVNAFDETAEQMERFLLYWLVRDQSPFALTEREELANGDVRIAFDGHCTECGYDVHARGYWFRVEGFSIYRVYATKPEDG